MKWSICERRRTIQWVLVGVLGVAGCKSVDPLADDLTSRPPDKRSRELAQAKPKSATDSNAEPSKESPTEASGSGAGDLADNPSAKRLEDHDSVLPTPTVTPASLQLATVGRALATSEDSKGVRFEFSPLQNPKPRVYHSAGGHIYVSSGLLERVSGTDELAGILAIEMAEFLCERRHAEAADSSRSAEGHRLAEEIPAAFAKSAPDPREVDRMAAGILRGAGYATVDVPKVRDQLEKWYLVNRPAEEKPSLGKMLAN